MQLEMAEFPVTRITLGNGLRYYSGICLCPADRPASKPSSR